MVITLLTDFGNPYTASMKGVILGIFPGANIVDISSAIPSYELRGGAFVLMSCARYFPSGTVHIGVVDPGVGTQRRAIAARSECRNYGVHYFIGPDNGLLIPAARSIGEPEVYEITNRRLFNPEVSSTFHGRDIFAPVGAHISKGMDISEVGKKISDFVDLDFGEGRKKGKTLEGSVIFIDSFGNIVTNIQSDSVDIPPDGMVEIDEEHVPFRLSYGFCEEGRPLMLIGSHGFLEIAVNKGNAADFFNKKAGDLIIINNRSQK